MAHLRDAKTSELIAEGTPLELVTIADELGGKAIVPKPGEAVPPDVDYLYDDVGLGFDPDAVRQGRDENLDGLAGAAKAEKDRTVKASLLQAEKAARAEVEQARQAAPDAQAALDAARDLLPG